LTRWRRCQSFLVGDADEDGVASAALANRDDQNQQREESGGDGEVAHA
jgi:hypothetical protein